LLSNPPNPSTAGLQIPPHLEKHSEGYDAAHLVGSECVAVICTAGRSGRSAEPSSEECSEAEPLAAAEWEGVFSSTAQPSDSKHHRFSVSRLVRQHSCWGLTNP
jgi:hypothetical protein